jgi:exodeoxyribonuclease VII large subunit
LSPLAVLERGYAIVEKPTGVIVRSADETAAGDRLNVRLHRGEIAVVVDSTHSRLER